jgi:hypothetical protein
MRRNLDIQGEQVRRDHLVQWSDGSELGGQYVKGCVNFQSPVASAMPLAS